MKKKIEEEESTKPLTLADLKGIGPISLKNLNDAGIYSLKDVLAFGPVALTEICSGSIDIEKAQNIVHQAKEYLQSIKELGPTFITGTEAWEERKNTERISTGCHELDRILLGGIEVGSTTEVYGQYGAGKSQLMHTLAVMAQLPKEQGGLNSEVLWLDTESTFRPERIWDIIIERELVPLKEQSKEDKKEGKLREPENPQDVFKFLDRIQVARIMNSTHQHFIMEHFGEILTNNEKDKKENDPKIRLLIIDSLMKWFRGEYLGRGQLSNRQVGVTEHIKLVTSLPQLYKIAIIYTNQIMSNPGMQFGDPTVPIGGNIISHSSTYRLYLIKAGKKHIARIVDSPMHGQDEVLFDLTRGGFDDFVEKK